MHSSRWRYQSQRHTGGSKSKNKAALSITNYWRLKMISETGLQRCHLDCPPLETLCSLDVRNFTAVVFLLFLFMKPFYSRPVVKSCHHPGCSCRKGVKITVAPPKQLYLQWCQDIVLTSSRQSEVVCCPPTVISFCLRNSRHPNKCIFKESKIIKGKGCRILKVFDRSIIQQINTEKYIDGGKAC